MSDQPTSADQPKPAPGADAAERQRTLALAGVASLLVLVLVIRLVHSSASGPAEPVTAGRGNTAGGGAAPFVAAGLDYAKLAPYYKPILDADPFKEHRFTPKRGPGTGGDTAPVPSSSPSSYPGGPPPGMVSLRFTGIFEDQGVALALLEDRISGKGMFVKKGDHVGPSVADVVSDSLVLAKADVASATTGAVTTIALGDKIDVREEDVKSKIAPIGPPQAFRDSSGALLPVLNDDDKKSVLERLKKKRQASLGTASPGG
jgi:hypothetical protein